MRGEFEAETRKTSCGYCLCLSSASRMFGEGRRKKSLRCLIKFWLRASLSIIFSSLLFQNPSFLCMHRGLYSVSSS